MGETFLFDNHKKSEVEGCPKRKKPHSDFDTHFRMFLHILRLVEDVSRGITPHQPHNKHQLACPFAYKPCATPDGASDDAALKLRSVMRLPPPPHEVLHFSCMKSP